MQKKVATLQEALRQLAINEDVREQSAEDAVNAAVGDDAASIDTEKVVDDVEYITKKIDIDPDEIYNANGDIERNLERALKIARREKNNNGKEWQDLCLVGDAGIGKTSRFWTWAHQHPEVKIKYYDAKTMDELDFKGKYINKDDSKDVKYSAVRSDEFDSMDSGEWVLFLDEFNRAKSNIRGTLLTLICDHVVPDPRAESGKRKLNGMLFTVVAVNPFNSAYNIKDEFDAAEKSRWKNVQVHQTPEQFRNYILNAIEKRLQVESDEEERAAWAFRYQIADKLLSDSRFHFDTPEEIEANSLSEDNVTNPRSVKRAIYASYDLDDFYDNFEGHCNPLKLNVVKAILGNFKVNDDRANQILNTYNTRSQEIFRD